MGEESGGKHLKLYVSGLAEGRPSVLRGDLVHCLWKSKRYSGRVVRIDQLYVIMEFPISFRTKFDVNLDRIDRVRFTFSRTPFRTSHAGTTVAPKSMRRS